MLPMLVSSSSETRVSGLPPSPLETFPSTERAENPSAVTLPSAMSCFARIKASLSSRCLLFVRLSATDWVEGGWDAEQSIELAKLVKSLGVDLVDCSSGGNASHAKVPIGPGYQTAFAERIRREAEVLTGSVGLITTATQADHIVVSGQADAVLIAREMLRDPYFPMRAARELGQEMTWPAQYLRAGPHGAKARRPHE